ncbi:MAG TPA: anthranilate phosphoribosyltransferase, partial [Planctomycetaceae bacterium]|nr:anthranilate phosphoribosyltransferase [Planctomycetaceae bacterium]
RVFSGARGPACDIVLANAAAALLAAGRVSTPAEGVLQAREVLASGAVADLLSRFTAKTRSLSGMN